MTVTSTAHLVSMSNVDHYGMIIRVWIMILAYKYCQGIKMVLILILVTSLINVYNMGVVCLLGYELGVRVRL